MHNVAILFMINDKKNPVARYRSFLDPLCVQKDCFRFKFQL